MRFWCARASNFTGHFAVMGPIQPDDLSEHVGVAGVALGARGGVPVPVAGRRHRVDRVDVVAGGSQGDHPWAAVGLDTNKNTVGALLGREVGPVRRGELGDHCVQLGCPLQPSRQSGFAQPPPALIFDLDVMVVLGPVVTDHHQHWPQLFLFRIST